jgi:HAD superfamily hydrolase (TIGR01509 family)
MPFNALIFDMDGTLVDNMGVHLDVWRRVLHENGVEVEREAFYRDTAGKTNPEILRSYLGAHLHDADVARLAGYKESLYRETYRPTPVPGLLPLLESAYRRGIPMALATSGGPPNIDFIVEALGIRPYFSVLVSAEEGLPGKPAPDLFLAAAARMGVEPSGCLVFEDALAGIEAARRAGMPVAVLTTTLSPQEVEGQTGVLAAAPDFKALAFLVLED